MRQTAKPERGRVSDWRFHRRISMLAMADAATAAVHPADDRTIRAVSASRLWRRSPCGIPAMLCDLSSDSDLPIGDEGVGGDLRPEKGVILGLALSRCC